MKRGVRPSRWLVLRLVAEECERAAIPGVTPELVWSRDRRRAVSYVRHQVIKHLCRMKRFSLPGIGASMGGLDHTSIMHARDRQWPVILPKLTKGKVKRPKNPVRMQLPTDAAPSLPASELGVSIARLMAGRA